MTCTVCGKTDSKTISATDAVSEGDASASDKNAGALLPTNKPTQKNENKGMPWWGILLIAVGAAGVGVGATYMVLLKNNRGNYYTGDGYRRQNYAREPYGRNNYGRGQESYNDSQYGYDDYADNGEQRGYDNRQYDRNRYRPDNNGRRNNGR